MITKTTRRASRPVAKRPVSASRTITAGTAITSGVRNRNYRPATAQRGVMASTMAVTQFSLLSFRQMPRKMSRVMAATNIPILLKPEFIELPSSVRSEASCNRSTWICKQDLDSSSFPFFKLKAENTKGETKKGDIFSTPFVNKQGMDLTSPDV